MRKSLFIFGISPCRTTCAVNFCTKPFSPVRPVHPAFPVATRQLFQRTRTFLPASHALDSRRRPVCASPRNSQPQSRLSKSLFPERLPAKPADNRAERCCPASILPLPPGRSCVRRLPRWKHRRWKVFFPWTEASSLLVPQPPPAVKTARQFYVPCKHCSKKTPSQ